MQTQRQKRADRDKKTIEKFNANLQEVEDMVAIVNKKLQERGVFEIPTSVDHSGMPEAVLCTDSMRMLKLWEKYSADTPKKSNGEVKKMEVARNLIAGEQLEIKENSLLARIRRIKDRLSTDVDDLSYKSRLPPWTEAILAGMIRQRQSCFDPMTAQDTLDAAGQLERVLLDVNPDEQKEFSRPWLTGFHRRAGIKSIVPERKAHGRIEAERSPGMREWYIAEGAVRGLAVDPKTGNVTGEDSCKAAGNYDETIVIIQGQSSQTAAVEGTLRVEVDLSTERQIHYMLCMPNTCVAIAPFVIQGFGLVACLVCFKYDTKSKRTSKAFQDELAHIRGKVRRAKQAAAEAAEDGKDPPPPDYSDVIAELAMSMQVASPSPTQLRFICSAHKKIMAAAGGDQFVYCATPSGYVNLGALMLVAQAFVNRLPAVRSALKLETTDRIIMYMDNLSFHHNALLRDFLAEHGVELRFLRKLTSATTQPLDVACMSSFKGTFRGGKRELAELVKSLELTSALESCADDTSRARRIRSSACPRLGEEWVGPLLVSAAKKAFRKDNVDGGFRKTGLMPFAPKNVPMLFQPEAAPGGSSSSSAAASVPMVASLEDMMDLVPIAGAIPAAQPAAKGHKIVTRSASSGAGSSTVTAEELVRKGVEMKAEMASAKLQRRGLGKLAALASMAVAEETQMGAFSAFHGERKDSSNRGRRPPPSQAGAGGSAEKLRQDLIRQGPRSEWEEQTYTYAIDEMQSKLQALIAEKDEKFGAGEAAAEEALGTKRRRRSSRRG